MPDPILLTVKEVAAVCGVTPRTVNRWVVDGLIHPWHTVTGTKVPTRLFMSTEVERFLATDSRFEEALDAPRPKPPKPPKRKPTKRTHYVLRTRSPRS